MPYLTVCTTVYPNGLPYFDEYCRGLATAITMYAKPVHLVLVCDELYPSHFPELVEYLRQYTELHMLQSPGGGATPARRLMLATAAALPVDAIVCYDMDDIPDPLGLCRHMDGLQSAEVSFGDLELIDQGSRPFGPNFFAGSNIPDRVSSPETLLRRNFIGFGNSAIRREIVAPIAATIPSDLTAADWWFFTTLLAKGYDAAKTDGPVVAYRTHGRNILGASGVKNDNDILRICRIMREHYAHLPQSDGVRIADQAVKRLTQMPCKDREALVAGSRQPGVWYDEVSRLCNQIHTSKSN